MGFILLIIGMIALCYILAKFSKEKDSKSHSMNPQSVLLIPNEKLLTDLEAEIEMSTYHTIDNIDIPTKFTIDYIHVNFVIFVHFLLLQDLLSQTETPYLSGLADYNRRAILFSLQHDLHYSKEKSEKQFGNLLALYLEMNSADKFVHVDIMVSIKKFKMLLSEVVNLLKDDYNFEDINIDLSNQLVIWAKEYWPNILLIHKQVIASPIPVSSKQST